MKKYIVFTLLLAAYSYYGQAQTRISGRVLDAKTNEPLPYATVYINNTTINTLTNADGEFLLSNFAAINSELICSFVGYQTYQLKITEKTISPISVRLNASIKNLDEITVKDSRDKNWEKQIKKFNTVFLGDGPFISGCKILNPWVVDLKTDGNVMSASASQPLEIENKSLGYILYFQLKTFQTNGSSWSILGNSRFVELPAPDKKTAALWAHNRERAYLGSAKHLMKSIIDHRIKSEGYVLYTDKEQAAQRTYSFAHDLEESVIKFDTVNILSPDINPQITKIRIQKKLEVHYVVEFSRVGFYKDVTNPVSWLEVKNGYIRTNSDGTILNPAEITISGDMANIRVADMLPLDYQRGYVIPVQSPYVIRAKRLQESVFVETDRSWYRSGETIWMSVFMNYRAPGMADSLSRVLYVDLVSPKKERAYSLKLPINKGRTSGNITLPDDIAPGIYTLTSYTNWMKNYGSSGVFTQSITVLDKKEVAKTLSSNMLADDTQFKIIRLHDSYQKGDSVELQLNFGNEETNTKASLCLSVVDSLSATTIIDRTSSIYKFSFPDDLPKDMAPKFKFELEKGLSFEGKYSNKKGKPQKSVINIGQENSNYIHNITTTENGNFFLRNLSFFDETTFMLLSTDGKITLQEISSDQFGPRPFHIAPNPVVANDDKVMNDSIENAKKNKNQYKQPYGKPDLYMTAAQVSDYASVAAAIVTKMQIYKLSYYNSHTFIVAARAESLSGFDNINHNSDGTVASPTTAAKGNSNIISSSSSASSSNEPQLYIDNVQFFPAGETVGDRLSSLTGGTIEHIEVLSMMSAGQGANGAAGAVYVFTQPDIANQPGTSLSKVTVRGFDRAESFKSWMSPSIGNPPGTIYWNPLLDIASGKKNSIRFKVTRPGKYKVIAEGMSNKGEGFRKEIIIGVK